ncbi:MAG: sensory histidine kinase AtoS [Verrucomicrobiales bacterium]|nr:sensory histidine kinase AtoS [Verrucomicrobiales bacterium]MDB6130370.1 sensory histidine kinase AtoS [Verrucomicrobiales bacterium]
MGWPSLRISATMAKDSLETKLFGWFAAVTAISIFVACFAVQNSLQAVRRSDSVNQTHAAILEIQQIVSSLKSAENKLLIYLVSGEPKGEVPFRQELANVQEHLDVARALVISQGNSDQELRIRNMASLIASWTEEAQSLITTLKLRGPDGVIATLKKDRNFEQVRSVEEIAMASEKDQNLVLSQRDRDFNDNARLTRLILFSGTLLNFILLASLFILIRIDLKVRRLAAQALQEANNALEERVKQRTEDLLIANEQLQLENLERQWAHSAMERHYQYSLVILDSLAEGVFVVSERGNILQVNAAAARMCGAVPKELIGKSVRNLLVNVDNSPVSNQTIAQQNTLAVITHPGRLTRRDGQTFPVDFNFSPLRGDGKLVGAVITVAPVISEKLLVPGA